MVRPVISAIAHANPTHRLNQSDVVDVAATLFGGRGGFEKLRPIFTNSRIETRYMAMPLEWYLQNHSWAEMNAVYIEKSTELLADVCRRLFDDSAVGPEEIDAIVLVSTTGIANPSLETYLMDRLPFSRWVRRTPVWGWGCAGGLIGLQRASELAKEGRVLLLACELCSLSFRKNSADAKDLVSAALFADGAAAVILEPEGEGWSLESSAEYRWSDSSSVMGWDVLDEGLSVVFARHIPQLVAEEYPQVLDSFRRRFAVGKVDRFLAHPGGAKIVDELERVYGLEPGRMAETRDVLRDFGNMSSPSVLFVLEKFLDEPGTAKRALLTTFGPGFTCGLSTITRDAA